MVGTHFTLLREPQSNAAKVFLFGERVGSQKIDVWRFMASADTSRVPSLSTPSKPLSWFFPVPHPDTMQNDLFCNGHAPLPDGRMLFIGGWFAPSNPCEMSYLFRPSWTSDSSGTPWTLGATMATERWYATATSMADGRILAAGGLARNWHAVFGGITAGDTTDRLWRSLAIAGRSNWGDTTAVPGYAGAPDGQRAPSNGYTAGQFPPSRTDHAFASQPLGRALMFGGRQVKPGGASTVLSDAWLWVHADERVAGDSAGTWQLLKQMDWNGTPGVAEVVPCARTRAALVWSGYANDKNLYLPGNADSLTFYLFGGLDADANALGDLWKGTIGLAYYEGGIGLIRPLRWERLLDNDSDQRRRFGHSMWFDPGDADQFGAPYARLLIFGGQIGDSTLASAKVYRYGVGSSVSAVWDSVSPTSSGATWGSPIARQGHAFTHRWPLGYDKQVEFFFYGGQDARGNLQVDPSRSPLLDTHLWSLTRSGTASSPTYQWRWIAWTNPSSGWAGPLPRARAAMVYDDESGRLVVSGGDLNGDGQAGERTDTLWTLQLSTGYLEGEKLEWKRPAMRNMGHAPMPPTSGHAMISYGDAGYRMDNSLEMYSAGISGDQCEAGVSAAGSWKTFSIQDPQSQRAISWYPFLFLLPDGRLFHAGPAQGDRITSRPYRRFFHLNPLDAHYREWTDNSSVYTTDAWAPGSAVMYRPGKILRAGSHAGDDNSSGATVATPRTETIEVGANAVPAWVVYGGLGKPSLAPRLNHNLTVLPNGDVLATGGVKGVLDPTDLSRMAVQRPQLWSVQSGGWNDTLSSDLAWDPKIRNYHSSALLLPDARVMTAGGEKPNARDRFTVSIYEPPYLFSGNDYARRPVIKDGPEHLRYGEPFTIQIGTGADSADVDSIRGVALLRPGAATHGFDQSQRYVPLDFVARKNRHRLLVWAPVDSFLAPPGEYMLFVTLGRGNGADELPVPSLAKWVIVERPQGVQRDSLDTTPPRGGAGFNLATLPCETGTEAPLNLHLSWTAPGDDDSIAFSGRAKSYNLRWTTNSGTPPDFNLWSQITTAAPNAALTAENAVATPVSSGTWYRFGLKAVGDNADTSSIGELVATRVQCEGGSSGGGGGEHEDPHARRAGGFGQRPGVAAPPEENTLLAGVPLGTRARDVLRLTRAPGLSGSMRRAFVRQGHERGLLVGRARLLAVDHPSGTEVVSTSDGELLSGERLGAVSVLDRLGRDVSASATGRGEEPVYGDSGEVFLVTLTAPSEPVARVALLELMGGDDFAMGVTVEAEATDGGWQPLATIHPRRKWATLALPPTPAARMRLSFHGAYALRFAGVLFGAVPTTAQSAALVRAESNYSGDAFDQDRGAVDSTLAMVAGDTLSLLFTDLPEVGEAMVRTWLLEVEGTPVTARAAKSLAQERHTSQQVSLPTCFALLPPAPNPTRGTVRLSFDLPVRTSARLEVFDPQGRRVRRFDGAFAAGRQAFEWDLRHSSGPRVAPGIYNYRLTAGPFTARGRVVVLQ